MCPLDAYGFVIQIKLPTRVTSTSKSCIDHMVTQNVESTETHPTTKSDHFTVCLLLPRKMQLMKQWSQTKPYNDQEDEEQG